MHPLPLTPFLPLTLAHPFSPNRIPHPLTPTNPLPSLCGTYPLPYCSGTNYTLATPSHRRAHLCGDSRLGPIRLPDLVLPLDSLFDIYSRFGTTNAPTNTTDLCPAAFLARWWNTTTDRFNYPPENGYSLDDGLVPVKGNVTLRVGVLLDRFGGEGGTFLSPAGAPFLQRALPPGNLGVREGEYPVFPYNYHVYRVVRPLLVRAGPIAPWFGQPGQGVQYETLANVTTLVAMDFLKRVDPREILKEEGTWAGGGGRGKGKGRGGAGEEEIFNAEETFEGEDGEFFYVEEEDEEGFAGFGGGEDGGSLEVLGWEEEFGEGEEEAGSTSFEEEEDPEFLDETGALEKEGGEIPGEEDFETFGEDEESGLVEGGEDEALEEGGGSELDVSDGPVDEESE